MPLVKSAAEINREIAATMPPPPPPPPPPTCRRTEDHLGPLQYALLEQIRLRPYWVVDREFWRRMTDRLHVPGWHVRKVFRSLELSGYILVSERDDPRIVQAKDGRRR